MERLCVVALFAGWMGLGAYLMSGNDTFLDRLPDSAGGTAAKVLLCLAVLFAPFFFGGIARAISASAASARLPRLRR